MASTSASGNKRKTITPSASSSASKLRQRPSYDIFINHRGPDVKHTLAASLYSTLTGMSLSVFLDSEELEFGDLLPGVIQTAIASAMLHIAIFSKSYANSPWCLAELSFMLETGAKIIPIFYRVEPSDLRCVDQGEYAQAFKDHERKGRYSPKQLQEWKNALHKVSFHVGHIIDTNEDEKRLLKNIVSCVLQEIKNEPFFVAKHLVGMEEIVEDFKVSTLQSAHSSQDVRIVGIWGMGGSGKTTLAKAIYNDMRSSMERSSFLLDVGDAATEGLLLDKQKNLLNDLGVQNLAFDNVEEGMRILARSLSSFRVLIVCDNVDHVEQLDVLLPGKYNLGKGSLVIVTAQELGVIKSWGISSIYKMKPLDPLHAKQLLCWHAFLNPYPPHEFKELVEKFVNVCEGLPLSLKVLGGQLYGESQKEIWEELLCKTLSCVPTDIQKILRRSYDILDNEEKEMFLDVACFFIGEKSCSAIEVWNAMGWSGLHGLQSLLNNCLVELDNNNLIRMHNHLRDLGREIASKQSPIRLWLPQQIINVKKQEKNNIRGINFGPTEIGEWSSSGDKYMADIREEFFLRAPSLVGLKLLVIRGDFLNQVVAEVLRELLWLRWFQSGQRIIPAWLSLKYLRVLELYEDSGGEHQLEELWDEDSDHPLQLRELVISDCHKLRRFPNSIGNLMHLKRILITSGINLRSLPEEFCRLQSLEHLQLCNCVMLLSLPSEFGDLRGLRHLDLSNCKELRRLPNSFKNLTILLHLNLQGCGQLTLRSEDFENITKLEFLNLSWCEQLEKLPRHVTEQVFLRELYLNRMKKLSGLPLNIAHLGELRKMSVGSDLLAGLPYGLGYLTSLTHFSIKYCDSLSSLPDSLGNLTSLTHFSIGHCDSLSSLPDSIGNLTSLTHFSIEFCDSLSSLPDSLGNLTSLTHFSIEFCVSLSSLPDSIGNLTSLTHFSIECLPLSRRGLPITLSSLPITLSSLPDSIGNLTSLTHFSIENLSSLPDSIGNLTSLTHFSIGRCDRLSSLPDSIGNLTSLTHFSIGRSDSLSSLPDSIGNLTSLTHFSIKFCKSLSSLPDSIENLTSLTHFSIEFCDSLSSLPDSLGNLTSLTHFSIENCHSLSSLPDSLGNLTSITHFSIEYCPSLSSLPDSLKNFSSLTYLSTEHCHIPNSLPDFLRHLSSLTYLSTQNCPSVAYCRSPLGDLTNLKILNSPELLPDYLEQLPKLEKLNLSGFPHRNLPWLQLRNLLVLELHGADEMEELWENEDHAPLQLRELIMTGTWSASFQRFPSSISYLSNLKSIALLGDAGKGFGIEELPEKFCDLRSLERLELRYCTLLSSLPVRFGDLRNLRHLNLSYCKALRILPVSFQQLKLLNYLDLSGCKRLVLWKDVLENIRQLENLYLSGCLALQKMPHQITDQACLRELHLQNTYLEDLPSDIGQLSKLEVLTIGSPLLKSLPDSLGNLSSLKSLSITNCFTLKSLPKTLGHLALLEHLCMEATGVSYLPEGFRRLGNLGTLKISDCPLRDLDFGLVSSFSLEKLMEINLSETLVTRISISGQCCPRLETLRLRQNDNLEVIENLPETIKNIEFSECEMLKNIKAVHALPVHPKLTISDCPELEKRSEFGFLEIEKQLEKKGSVELVSSEGSSEGDIDFRKTGGKGSSESESEVEKQLKKKRAVHFTAMSDSE